jgi:hypothetical protein
MHDNSLRAYEEEKDALGNRAKEILKYLEGTPRPQSDRDIRTAMGFTDMNHVRPRLTELIRVGLVFEVGRHRCAVTGKTVRIVLHRKFVEPNKRQLELF